MDERFHVFEGGWRARLRRDLRLLRFLATITYGWVKGGGKVRKAHRRAQVSGETFYIDRLAGRGKYD
ncbi:MAG: hypothetical protein RLT05_34665 [Bauldia litoralis]